MSVQTSLPTARAAGSKITLPYDCKILLRTLAIPLAVWVIVALTVRFAIPYDSPSWQNFATYADYVVRNGGTFMIFLFIYVLRKLPKTQGESSIVTDLKGGYRAYSDHAWQLPIMLLASAASFMLFMFSYMSLKVRIEEVVPFKWDALFAQWDKALFFGTDPWRVFAWVYDVPFLVPGIDFVYEAWAGLLVGSWIVCFVMHNIPLKRRIQFCLSMLIAWFFGGNILATVFSSVGPCYYEHVTGDPYFAEQIQRLANVKHLVVLETQNALWVSHIEKSNVGGISAMPSMHCTTAFLFFLMFGRTRLSRLVTLSFFALIWVSSVILAWHYAIDGLLAIPVAISSWMAAGWISRRVTAKHETTGAAV